MWVGHKLGSVGQSQGISRAGLTVLTRLMQSQIWHEPAGSVALVQKRDISECLPDIPAWEKAVPSSHLDARHFAFSLYATGTFQVATLVLQFRGSESD